MSGGGLQAPFSCLACLLIACCDCFLVAAALVLTNTEPQNLECPATGAKSLAFIATNARDAMGCDC